MLTRTTVVLLTIVLMSSCSGKDLPNMEELQADNGKLKINLNNYKTQEHRFGTGEGQDTDAVVVMAVSVAGHRSANFAMGGFWVWRNMLLVMGRK